MQLYINTYGTYLHIKDQMFEIRIKKEDKTWEKHHYSAKKVKTIVLSQGTALSSAAVKLAVTNNIDILFVERDGRPIGRVWHSKLGSTTRIRKEQLVASMNQDGLKAVKALVKDDKTPMGCAAFGKASIIFLMSSSTIDFFLISL